MAGAQDFWSLSGRPNDYIPTGTRDLSSSGNDQTTQNTSGSQTTFGSSSKSNIPQPALDALLKLINDLQDHPTISDAELDKQVPLPQLRDYALYQGNVHDAAGNPAPNGYDYARYNRDLAEAKAKREEIQRQGGVTPGGTEEQRRESTNRQTEIAANREEQGKYSKEAAFADATALSGRFSRQLLEQVMPQLTRAMESSGTSGGAVGGLLANDAAARVAEAQAALGLDTATKYGSIWANLAQTLEALTRQNNPTLQALIQALAVAKGSVENSTSSQTTSTNQSMTSSTNKNQNTKEIQVGNPALSGDTGTVIQSLANSLSIPNQSSPVYNGGGSSVLSIKTAKADSEYPMMSQKQSSLNQILNNLVIS